MRNSKPPIWWGDSLGLAVQENETIVTAAVLNKVIFAACMEHGAHMEMYWSDGTMVISTPVEGWWVVEPEDAEISRRESAYYKEWVKTQIAQVMDQQIERNLWP